MTNNDIIEKIKALAETLKDEQEVEDAWKIIIPEIGKRIGKKKHAAWLRYTMGEMGETSVEAQVETLIQLLIETIDFE